MDQVFNLLCFVIFLKSGLSGINAAVIMNITVSPLPPTIGSAFSVKCDSSISSSVFVNRWDLLLTNENEPNVIISLSSANLTNPPLWGPADTAGATEQLRANVSGSLSQRYMSLNYISATCADDGRLFICRLTYQDNGPIVTNKASITNYVESNPSEPDQMAVSPNNDTVTEGTMITFTCRGNVGRKLPGDDTSAQRRFRWFKYVDGPGIEINQTLVVNDVATLVPGGCTYTRRSTLTLKANATEVGKPMVIRCRIDYGDSSVTSPCDNPATQFCRMSQEINVQYPVQVQIAGQCSGRSSCNVEQGSSLSLQCNTRGNPNPYLVQWFHDDQLLANSSTYDITKASLSDNGSYTCNASNVVGGITRTASASLLVTVVQTTTTMTTKPTTRPSSSTSLSGDTVSPGATQEQIAEASKVNVVAIVVPVVVGGAAIIVVIIVIIVLVKRKRTKNPVEEPPEKPYNNNASLNSISARPDLVINDKAIHSYDVKGHKAGDSLTYATLHLDNKPRSRRGLAIDDTQTDYSDVSMPQV